MARDEGRGRGRRPISRREFMERGAAGGLAAAAAMSGVGGLGSGVGRRPARDFDLAEATIAGLQRMMADGERTARSIAELYVGWIEANDRQGPALRQVLEVNPDALETADRLDRERAEKGPRGPLHGIPILLKDNIATRDRMETTAGSLALVGSKVAADAHVAKRLRDAGAVLLGKTNLSEWANFRSSDSSSGWSGRGGQGKNPYALDRSPCGSSSGSGAAASANFCAAAVGTETDGSVVCPAAANSVVGIKPTLGLVSRGGIVPIAHSQDTAGPMARTVADAAALLTAMAGIDPADEATAASRGKAAPDYTRFLDPDGLKGARIGIPREKFYGYSEEADRVMEDAIAAMRDAGATIVDPVEVPHAGDYDDAEYQVLLYEFKHDVNAYLAALSESPVRTLEDLIRFNEEHADEELKWFGQDVFEEAQGKGGLDEREYRDALGTSKRLSRQGLDAALDGQRLDALVAPTGSPPWTIDLVNGDHFLGAASTPAAVSGYASISVPGGYVFGLPVGVTFIGRAWSEPTLIRLASAFERATGARRTPGFTTSAELLR